MFRPNHTTDDVQANITESEQFQKGFNKALKVSIGYIDTLMGVLYAVRQVSYGVLTTPGIQKDLAQAGTEVGMGINAMNEALSE